MFQLTIGEWQILRSQFVTLNNQNPLKLNTSLDLLRSQIVTSNKGGSRYLPYAFTEQGVAMLSGMLNSEIAINLKSQLATSKKAEVCKMKTI
jgi:hypothetical protein